MVVTVYPEENPIGVGRVDAEWVAYMREQAEEASAAARRFLAGAERASSGSSGRTPPRTGSTTVAEQAGASMIVVGSSPRGARRRISPGSTGERLLHGASCPVAIAPRGLRERPADTPVRRIGVAFVDSPDAHEAVGSRPTSCSAPAPR